MIWRNFQQDKRTPRGQWRRRTHKSPIWNQIEYCRYTAESLPHLTSDTSLSVHTVDLLGGEGVVSFFLCKIPARPQSLFNHESLTPPLPLFLLDHGLRLPPQSCSPSGVYGGSFSLAAGVAAVLPGAAGARRCISRTLRMRVSMPPRVASSRGVPENHRGLLGTQLRSGRR